MEIVEIEVIPLSCTLQKPIMDANLYIDRRDALLILIKTESGVIGIGESVVHGNALQPVSSAIKHLSSYIIGESAFNVTRIWEKLYQRSMHYGRRGIAIIALSGIDIALWDIIGKVANLPLYKILGGYQDEIPAYASGGFYAAGKGIEGLCEEMETYVKKGFSAVKMKVGRSPTPLTPKHQICNTSLKEDLSRVKMVRQTIGEDIDLMIDANNAWDVKTAIRFSNEIKELDPYFVEEPLSTDNIEGIVKVNRATGIPIAGNETAYTRFEFRKLIEHGAVDIVQADVSWAGGITEVRRIAALAAAHNKLFIPHSFSTAVNLTASLHLTASIPNSQYIELDQNPNPLRTDLLKNPLTITSTKTIKLPQEPGLGIDVDDIVLKDYQFDPVS